MDIVYSQDNLTLYCGDCLPILQAMPADSVDLVITSPPYNKRGHEGRTRKQHSNGTWQKGRNITYEDYGDDLPEPEYQAWQVAVLTELHRIVKDGGACFYNHKHRVKDYTVSLPTDWIARTPWHLRQEIVWNRTNSPNVDPIRFLSTTERVYWLFKGRKPAYFNPAALGFGEVWTIVPEPTDQHTAPFPEELVRRCLIAASRPGDTILDPFAGWGTVLRVAKDWERAAIGIERSAVYCQRAMQRLYNTAARQEALFELAS